MTFTGIILFVLAFITGLFSLDTPWLANIAVFLFGWAVALILIGMLPRDRVDTDSGTR